MVKATKVAYGCLCIWLSCCLEGWSRLAKCPALSIKEKPLTIWPKNTVLAGSNVTLRCRVPRTKRWRRQLSVPSNMYILTPSGYQMCQSQVTSPANEYMSCAMNMNQVNSGNGGYSVCVLNQGQTNCMLGDARLNVVDPDSAVFPQVALLSTNATSSRRVGHLFHLYCQATGRPQPMITWMKDDVSLENEPDIVIRQIDKHTSELTVASLRLTHQGTYSCAASNILGEAYSSKRKSLRIDPGPPVITLQPVQRNVTMATNVTLACATVGYPFPTVRWLKNGVAMEDSGIMERDREGTTWLFLELKSIKKSDLGDYRCVASNEMGRVKSVTASLLKEVEEDSGGDSSEVIDRMQLIYWLIASIAVLLILIVILICVTCIIAAKKQSITVLTKSSPSKPAAQP